MLFNNANPKKKYNKDKDSMNMVMINDAYGIKKARLRIMKTILKTPNNFSKNFIKNAS